MMVFNSQEWLHHSWQAAERCVKESCLASGDAAVASQATVRSMAVARQQVARKISILAELRPPKGGGQVCVAIEGNTAVIGPITL